MSARLTAKHTYKKIKDKNPERLSLGDRMLVLRINAKISQFVAARVINKSRTAISRYENNIALPNALDLTELCKLYVVEPNEMLGWEYVRR